MLNSRRASAVAAGLLLDAWLGEPPARIHPVAWHGRALRRLQRATERDSPAAGALHTSIAVGSAFVAGRLVRSTAAAVAVCASGRMLRAEARTRARSLVSRETAALTEVDLARAAVESLAENTSDAVTATAIWALAGGAPAALAQRASNTLDAMIGYRTERTGAPWRE